MLRKIFLFAIAGLGFIALSGCSEEKAETKNMTQLHKENGVPVKVTNVKIGSFQAELKYNAMLTGYEETSKYAPLGEKIERINVKVGDYVKKDQVLVTFPQDNPSAKYNQAKVAFENSRKMFERYKNLFETGGISKQQLDNIETQYEVDKANWDAVKQMINVKAPISGYVTKLPIRETDNVKKKELLFTISNLNKLKAKVKVPESAINEVKVGNDAIAEWNGMKIDGKVIQVDMAMDRASQSFITVLEFYNKERKIKSGITADIEIFSEADENVISIERKNLIRKNGNNFVYVAKNGQAKLKQVELGKSKGLEVEITKGLKEGDKLITQGQLLLEDGSKINIIK